MNELVQRLKQLAVQAKGYDIGFGSAIRSRRRFRRDDL